MRVIAHVLEGVDNDRLMHEQMEDSEAISDIVRAYNRLAHASMEEANPDQHLHVVGENTYGDDFKQWIAYLPAPERWRLLDRYLHLHVRMAEDPDEPPPRPVTRERRGRRRRQDDDEADKHTLRHFTIRFAILIAFLFMVLVLAAAVAFMQNNHMLPDNAVLKTVMETATEVAKILFTLK